MMIEITSKNRRNNLHELQVRAMLSQMIFYCQTVGSAFDFFQREVKQLKSSNSIAIEFSYKAFMADDNKSFEVYHIKASGDKDRHIATISTKQLCNTQ